MCEGWWGWLTLGLALVLTLVLTLVPTLVHCTHCNLKPPLYSPSLHCVAVLLPPRHAQLLSHSSSVSEKGPVRQ